jgi:hypothetical protein
MIHLDEIRPPAYFVLLVCPYGKKGLLVSLLPSGDHGVHPVRNSMGMLNPVGIILNVA